MANRSRASVSTVKTWEDLRAITGLGRETIKALIRAGELPGYKLGSRYVIPAAAFEAFCRGEWQANPHPILPEPIQAKPQFLHSMKREAS